MALTVNVCWMLVLSACLAVAAGTDCAKECELCLYHLEGRQTDLSLLTCVQECMGSAATTTSVDLCKGVISLGNLEEGLAQGANDPLDQLSKRYGGFMRRYGGFMKKSAEIGVEPAGELGKRYGGFMKKDDESRLDALRELLAAVAAGSKGGDAEGEAPVTRSSEQGDEIKALQKRYGGFMRRVGSPNWEESKKVYGGYLKRSWGVLDGDTAGGSSRTEKRYGGFMD